MKTPHKQQLRKLCFSTKFNKPASGYGNYIHMYNNKWYYDMITSGCLNCTSSSNSFLIATISTNILPTQEQVFNMICNYYELNKQRELIEPNVIGINERMVND